MSAPYSGRCACGAIQYEIASIPPRHFQFRCHCRDCQRASGSGYAPLLFMEATEFKLLQGEPTYFAVTGTTGNLIHRGFCVNCGATMFTKVDALPTFIAVMAASLDDPSLFTPSMEIWVPSAHPWDAMISGLPTFGEFPGYADPDYADKL